MRSPRVCPAGGADRSGRYEQGLTLVELLTSLVVLGILLIVATPGFETAVRRSEVTEEANRLLAEIQYARSEAIKRGSPVNLCRSGIAATCTESDCTCHTDTIDGEWHRGWLLYVSNNRDTSYDPDTGPLLRQSAQAEETIIITSDSNLNQWLSIGPSGSLDESGPGLLAVCANGVSTEDIPGRLVTISLTGRPSISTIPPGGSCTP